MSAKRRILRRRSSCGCLVTAVLIVLAYYAVQIILRTPPQTRLQNIAHRGGTLAAPENTLAAFQKGIEQGADWLEFDVQMTKDGALVVIHDVTVDRTTNGTGAVRDLTLQEIHSLDAGQGETVPTFEEVIALARAGGVKILPETKSAHLYPGVEEKLLQALEQANYLDQTVIQSFEAASLDTIHRLNPQAKLCPLYGLWQLTVSAPPGEAQYVCPMAEMVLLNPGLVRQAHQEGRQVFVYFGVLENSFGLGAMQFFGVDGLMVNDPAALEARYAEIMLAR